MKRGGTMKILLAIAMAAFIAGTAAA